MRACSINLVVALPAEAKPVTTHFGLARVQPDRGFALYRRGPVSLVVTGPGKVNAAAGTASLGSSSDRGNEAIWVNFGVAGHAERPIGEVLLASHIRDTGTGEVWRPNLPALQPCPADNLQTLDRPDLDYTHEGLVDMEASGFFPTACRYSRVELVQVLKVISDNRESTAHGLRAKQVRRLVRDAVGTLEVLLASLQARAEGRGEGIAELQNA